MAFALQIKIYCEFNFGQMTCGFLERDFPLLQVLCGGWVFVLPLREGKRRRGCILDFYLRSELRSLNVKWLDISGKMMLNKKFSIC